MSDNLVKRLRNLVKRLRNPTNWDWEMQDIGTEAADRIEQLDARVLLLEGYLNGALNIIEGCVACDTKEARAALEGKKDE